MDICEACIKCDKSWSAGRGASCHDLCEDFKQWKTEPQVKKSQETKTVYIPGAL